MALKILLFSGKQFSGKDTAAKIMMKKMPDFHRAAIGDSIKVEYGRQKGLSYEEIEKNKAMYRKDLITLGNWGRAQDPYYWLKKVIQEPGNIMVTDARVEDEYNILKQAGAKTIRVEASRETRAKRGTLVGEDDITEIGLDHIKDWDYVVDNNGTPEQLEKQLDKIVEDLKSSN